MSNADASVPEISVLDAVWVLLVVLATVVFGERAARMHCWLHGHSWADNDRYGVEPVCLICSSKRAYSEE